MRKLAKTIDKQAFKANAFSYIALATEKLNDTAIAKSLPLEALTAAKTMDEPDSKAKAFGAIADSYIELKDPASAKPVLQQAWDLAALTKLFMLTATELKLN